jgi:hypothetical protein
VLGILSEAFYLYAGWSASFTMGSIFWDVSYVVPGLALVVFPFVKKDLFQQSPGFVRWKVAGFPVVSIVGIITAIGFAWEGYIGFATGCGGYCTPTPFGWYLTAALVILGFVIYAGAWAYHKREGLDISQALKAIPPE